MVCQPFITYFGGNAEAVEDNAVFFKQHFSDHVTYLIPYRGYSGNSGAPEELLIYEDALSIFDLLSKKHRSLMIMGRSLGAAVAIYLAVNKKIDALILVTPFDSVENLRLPLFKLYPTKSMLTQKYDSVSRVGKIKAPTLILIAE